MGMGQSGHCVKVRRGNCGQDAMAHACLAGLFAHGLQVVAELGSVEVAMGVDPHRVRSSLRQTMIDQGAFLIA